jgi:hypothetical protein
MNRARNGIQTAYFLALCALLFAGFLAFASQCWTAIHSTLELDYGEGIVMWQADRVTHLSQAYVRLDTYPYIVFHYPPVYHLVSHYVAGFTRDLLAAGRWVSFVSALLTGFVIGVFTWLAIPRLAWIPRILGASVASLLCYNLDTIKWAELMRVDLLALFFTFTGLLVFLLADRFAGFDYVAIILFALALFTKQTEVAAPAACIAIAFLTSRARALWLIAFLVVLGCVGLAALAVPTHGAALLNLFTYNRNPFLWLNMLGIVQSNLASMAPLAAIALALSLGVALRVSRIPRPQALTVVRRWIATNRARRAIAMYSLYLPLALAVSLTCGKRGAGYNYFLEWNLACSFPVALVLVYVLRRSNVRKPTIPHIAVLLLPLLVGSKGVASLAQHMRPGPPSTTARDTANVTAYIEHVQGPVYSENMTILMMAHKEIPAEPAIITALAQTGFWDETDFVKRIDSGYFSAIIVTTSLDNHNRYTARVQAAIEGAYQIQDTFGSFRVYVPKSRGA